ncbi:aegerolysin [Amycolatopsis sulphurea]|uniref:Aegerolysin n=1 Tax=Amycolatopsis sulphurea TaxID=76022 RepID=A0A2A9FGX3_9PSEU|nr:aegerolysin family protein [Amycolatopsis sulphurea]PFG50614.1 aegerolysin [Amycolatopsis sulphurea]
MTKSNTITKDDDLKVESETIQFICTIDNRANVALTLQSKELKWGKFYDDPNFSPVETIPSKKEIPAFRTSGKAGSSSGTEGTVVYQFGDDAKTVVTIYWDVTWCAGCDNHLKAEASDDDIAVQVTGWKGSGSVEAVVIKVVDGRKS